MGMNGSPSLTRRILCDPETLQSLSGEYMHELYMIYRPTLTCDTFFEGDKKGLDTLIKLVASYIDFESRMRPSTTNRKVFLEYDVDAISEWQAQVRQQGGDEENYMVIGFGPSSLCEVYDSAMLVPANE